MEIAHQNDAIIQDDRRVSVREVSEIVGVSMVSVHKVMQKIRGYQRVIARWVTRQFKDSQ